jgi:hypothetical protein
VHDVLHFQTWLEFTKKAVDPGKNRAPTKSYARSPTSRKDTLNSESPTRIYRSINNLEVTSSVRIPGPEDFQGDRPKEGNSKVASRNLKRQRQNLNRREAVSSNSFLEPHHRNSFGKVPD